jgi:twitching motility protein PilT
MREQARTLWIRMARVDSILAILVQQGANELRLGTDREPKILAYGVPKRLSIPGTPEETLRELLGEILEAERERTLRAHGRVDLSYEAAGIGSFQVKIASRADGGGFDAVFVRASTRAAPPAAAGAPVPVVTAVAPPPPTRPSFVESPSAVLERLVSSASALGASDLHLVQGKPPIVRVDGRLRQMGDEPLDLVRILPMEHARESSHEPTAAGAAVDGAIDLGGAGRARLHVYRTSEGLAAALRLLPAAVPSLASLRMPVPLEDLVDLPHGLVLVCGATGSGKSTTLAALAQEALHRRSIVLLTLEDPIEHGLSAPETSVVRRREVGRDVRDFAHGLRDALREDPDVILLGEMRDPETIALALTAAETGHLVLSSLHSGSAASAIERIVDAYPPARQGQIRVQLADSLRAVVAQRLLPRARGHGRVVAIEVLRGTHAVAALVREGKTAQIATAIQSGKREGMLSLERCLADRVQSGEVRLDDARAAANDPASLAMYLGK